MDIIENENLDEIIQLGYRSFPKKMCKHINICKNNKQCKIAQGNFERCKETEDGKTCSKCKDGFYLNDVQRYFYTLIINYQKFITRFIKVADIIYEFYKNVCIMYIYVRVL